MRSLRIFIFWLLALWSPIVQPVTLLHFAESLAGGDLKETPTLGIEIEMIHSSRREIAGWMQQSLGGVLRTDGADEKLLGTDLGTLIFKYETNDLEDGITRGGSVIEIVTEPLSLAQIQKLDQALKLLKSKGVLGTEKINPVSIQTNLPVPPLAENIPHVLNLLRNYFWDPHQAQIRNQVPLPAARLDYLGAYSAGFMKRLSDPSYQPTGSQLYADFFYRQSLELLGHTQAWELTDDEAQKLMAALGYPVVPRVAKLNSLRISSWLLMLEPNQPYTKALIDSEWIRPEPILEFRDWNNDFNPLQAAHWTLGLWNATLSYGAFDFDRLASEISTVPEAFLQDIRKGLSFRPDDPLVVRYFLGEETPEQRAAMKVYEDFYWGTVWGFLPYATYGVQPLIIPGESVVFHRRPYHGESLLGRYNPGLQNKYLAQALENKYVEMLFWEMYAPGSVPKTLHLATHFAVTEDLEELQEKLNEKFPKGWLLKGVWDLATEEESLISHKIQLSEALKSYLESDFEAFRERMERYHRGTDPEDLIDALKQHPGHLGWRLSQLLQNPHLVMVQEHLDILQEFRVEAISGEVLGGGATTDRYYYKKENWNPADFEEHFAKVDEWVQSELLGKLPEQLRVTPFSFDVALLADGSLRMIESNPGGNSGFLGLKGKNIRALNEFLKHYPERLRRGELYEGLSPEEQMNYLVELFSKFGIRTEVHYPGIEFLPSQMFDPEFPQRKPNPTKWQQEGKRVCQSFLLAV